MINVITEPLYFCLHLPPVKCHRTAPEMYFKSTADLQPSRQGVHQARSSHKRCTRALCH